MADLTTLLVLGGARSGKSAFAQARAEAFAGGLVFVATAESFDAEMTERIDRHRADRGPRWHTIEAPLDLPGTIARASRADRLLLIDCLTLWTSNLILGDRDTDKETRRLTDAIVAAPGPLIIVANEVGLGIVPDNPLARRFRDAAGRLNQAVARCAHEVMFVAAGLPLRLK